MLEYIGYVGALHRVPLHLNLTYGSNMFKQDCFHLMDGRNDAIIIVQGGEVKYVNGAVSTVSGYSSKELVGMEFRDFIRENTNRIAEMEYESGQDGREALNFFATEILNKDGSRLPAEGKAEMTEYVGKPAILIVLRDVSEQNKVMAALQEREARCRAIIENIEDGYFELDLLGSITFVNEAACKLLGYLRREMIGMNFRQFSNQEAIGRLCEAGNRTFRTGEPVKRFDWEVIGMNGTKRQVETSLTLMKGPHGDPIGFRGIVRDITERKRAKEEVQRARQEKIDLIEQTTEAIISIGIDGKIETANPAAERLFARSLAELRKISIGAILASSSLSEMFPNMSFHDKDSTEKCNGGKVRNFEAKVSQPDGTWIPVMLNASVRKDEQGNPRGLVMAISDIREQRRMQRQLLDMAHQSGMAEIAAGILHNINNVLTSVVINSELLQENIENSRIIGLEKALALMQQHMHDLPDYMTNDPKGRLLPEYFENITKTLVQERDENLERANKLIKYIGQVKALVSTQQRYARAVGLKEMVDPGEVLEDVLAMHSGIVQRHNIRVVKNYKYVQDISIDRQKLMQILLHLVKNALESLLNIKDKKEPVLSLGLATRSLGENATLIISVRDNGVGISQEEEPRIFEYGFTTKKHGSGFGLHTAGLAVKEMGGSIFIYSEGREKGAEFVVELPREQSASMKSS